MDPLIYSAARSYARYAIDLRLIVRTSIRIYGWTRDISEGGVGATIPDDLSMGEVGELEFLLPNATEPLAIVGEIIYRQGFQYGFQFIEPTPQQVEAIRRATRFLPIIR